MSENVLNADDLALLCRLKTSLSLDRCGEKLTDAVWKAAYSGGVATLIADNPNAANEKLLAEARTICRQELFNTINVYKLHCELNDMLTAWGVPYVIIKGCASAEYYPEPLKRSMGDVDFLVHPKYVERTAGLLESVGFERENRHHSSHEILFSPDGARYELHREPAGIPGGRAGELLRSYLVDTVDSGVDIATPFGIMRVPDAFHHGLIILLHNAHHLSGSGMGLRQLCDWHCFLSKIDETDFIQLFVQKLKACGLFDFARITTALCVRFLSLAEQHWIGDVSGKLLDALMVDILSGGNFGQSDPNRFHESLLLAGKNNNESRFAALQLAKNTLEVSKDKFNIKHKFSPRIPLGAAFLSSRYLLRSIKGSRPKIHLKETISESQKRKELYSQFNLFKTEGEDEETIV